MLPFDIALKDVSSYFMPIVWVVFMSASCVLCFFILPFFICVYENSDEGSVLTPWHNFKKSTGIRTDVENEFARAALALLLRQSFSAASVAVFGPWLAMPMFPCAQFPRICYP